MKSVDFENLVKVRCDSIQRVLVSKAREYATDKDRLHNFKRAAALNCETPETISFFINCGGV